QSAEEIDLPPRRIGVLLVVSVFLAVAFYVLVSFSVAGALPPRRWPTAELATADAATALWGGSWAGVVLVIGGIGGILTSWNAFIIRGGRGRLLVAGGGW